MLPGSVQNTPGADNKSVKDSEATIQQDSDMVERKLRMRPKTVCTEPSAVQRQAG